MTWVEQSHVALCRSQAAFDFVICMKKVGLVHCHAILSLNDVWPRQDHARKFEVDLLWYSLLKVQKFYPMPYVWHPLEEFLNWHCIDFWKASNHFILKPLLTTYLSHGLLRMFLLHFWRIASGPLPLDGGHKAVTMKQGSRPVIISWRSCVFDLSPMDPNISE